MKALLKYTLGLPVLLAVTCLYSYAWILDNTEWDEFLYYLAKLWRVR